MAKRATFGPGDVVWFTHKDAQIVARVERVVHDVVVVKLPCGKLMKGLAEKFRAETVAGTKLNTEPVWSLSGHRKLPKRGIDAYRVGLRLNGVIVLEIEVANGFANMVPDPHAPSGIALTFYRWLKRWYGEDACFVSALDAWIEHRRHHAETPLEEFLLRRRVALELVADQVEQEAA